MDYIIILLELYRIHKCFKEYYSPSGRWNFCLVPVSTWQLKKNKQTIFFGEDAVWYLQSSWRSWLSVVIVPLPKATQQMGGWAKTNLSQPQTICSTLKYTVFTFLDRRVALLLTYVSVIRSFLSDLGFS